VSKKADKKKKKEEAAPAGDGALRIAAHPRAGASIRRARARAGLAALVLCTVLGLRAGLPLFDAVARGLAAGVAAQFVAWFAGLVVWRHLIVGEIAAHRERIEQLQAERRAAAEAAAQTA
jgi:hypothetical protein